MTTSILVSNVPAASVPLLASDVPVAAGLGKGRQTKLVSMKIEQHFDGW